MKKPVLLLLAVTLAAGPAHAQTKRRKSSGDGDAHLPPKSPMLQLTPADGDATPQTGLISSELSGRDLAFLTSAVEAGRTQVALCKTAKDKGESDQVRAVGDALGGTQSQENIYVTRLAAKKGLPLDPNGAPSTEKKTAAELASLSGANFDKQVMEKIIAAAQQSVSSYEAGTQSSDPEIKSLAERLLPVAKDKLQLANSIYGRSQQAPGKPAFRNSGPAAPSAAATPAPKPGATPASAPAAAAKPGATPASAPAGKPGVKAAVVPATPPPRPDGPKPVPVLNPPAPGGTAAAAPAPLAKPSASPTPTAKPSASPTPAATPAKPK